MMSNDLVKRLRDWEFVYPEEDNDPEGSLYIKAADRIEELEAAMASIEEYGTESLNALPDCLMKLAPALVRIEKLEDKLTRATAVLRKVDEWFDELEMYTAPDYHLAPALKEVKSVLQEIDDD